MATQTTTQEKMVGPSTLSTLLTNSHKRSRFMFDDSPTSTLEADMDKAYSHIKMRQEYQGLESLPAVLTNEGTSSVGPQRPRQLEGQKMVTAGGGDGEGVGQEVMALARSGNGTGDTGTSSSIGHTSLLSKALIRRREQRDVKPDDHADWKLMRVISGHLGWVRSIAVEPGNQWFVTGAGDRTIKVWDLASGQLKLSLTGHISTVRGLAVSPRHPYLFSCGEDKMVKCWDLEVNKVIRHYHGHLSGVYSLALHPTLDVLVTSGRDGSARVWDMRTKNGIHVLTGHKDTVSSVLCQDSDPQVITASMDSTVRLWDLAAGKTMVTMTHHKKAVRALALHPTEFSFASASVDNIKRWKCPNGTFVHNFPGHNAIVNTLAINPDGVLFTGGDNGHLGFFDWKTGYKYQSLEDIPQSGSLEAEAGVFASTFDQTGLRLLTAGADKTIKIYKQV